MRTRHLSIFIFCSTLAPLRLLASFEERPASVRSAALGESAVASGEDPGVMQENPALIRSLDGARFSSAYATLYGVPGVAAWNSGVSFSTRRRGAWGLFHSRYGPDFYREEETALAAAFRAAAGTAVGFSVRRSAVRLARFGEIAALGADAGLVKTISNRFQVGFSARNLNRPRFAGTSEGPAPSFRAGARFSLFAGGETFLALARPLLGPISQRVGQEIRPCPGLALRFGAETHPSLYTAGFGVRLKGIGIDYALVVHPVLGNQHHMGLSWTGTAPKAREP